MQLYTFFKWRNDLYGENITAIRWINSDTPSVAYPNWLHWYLSSQEEQKLGEPGWITEVLDMVRARAEFVRRNGFSVNEKHLAINDGEAFDILSKYPDLIKAWGMLIRWTPWKGEAANDDILRVYYSYEQQEINENKLVELVKGYNKENPIDKVVTLPTWWVNIGAKIARAINRPLWYIHATAYDKNGNKWELKFSKEEIDAICEWLPKDSRILLIDDLSHSGQALNEIKAELQKRRMEVVTATTYRKERSSHTPDICPFPHHPDLWIVQPSEYREWPVEGHDKAWIKNHPVTQCIEKIVHELSKILDETQWIHEICFYVPKDAFDPRVSMAVAKILKDKYREIDFQFVSTLVGPTVIASGMTQEVSWVYWDITLKTSIMIPNDILWISLVQFDPHKDIDRIHSELINGYRVPVSNLLASRVKVTFRIHYKYYDSWVSASNLWEKLMREFPGTSYEVVRWLGPTTNLSYNPSERIIVIEC